MTQNEVMYGVLFYVAMLAGFILRTIWLQRVVWKLQDKLMKKDMEQQSLIETIEQKNIFLEKELNENHYLRLKLEGYPA